MRRLCLGIAVVLVLFSTLGMGGCNTVQGVGKDIQGVGEAIKDAAD
jgi:predicted small secreted protein